jgi:hypothetical protein
MWKHYRRTFWAMQFAIASVTLTMAAWSRPWTLVAWSFATMQASSIIGAFWAHRLGDKARPCRLPASEG